MLKRRPITLVQNKVGARPMMLVMGTQIKPPKAMASELVQKTRRPSTDKRTHIIKTFMLFVSSTVELLSWNSIDCKIIGALPAADVKSAQNTLHATVSRMRCFLDQDQFRGSISSSLGWGTRTV